MELVHAYKYRELSHKIQEMKSFISDQLLILNSIQKPTDEDFVRMIRNIEKHLDEIDFNRELTVIYNDYPFYMKVMKSPYKGVCGVIQENIYNQRVYWERTGSGWRK